MQRFFQILLILCFVVSASFAQTKTDVHVVKKGETLYSLSQKYNTTVSKLLDLNPTIIDNKLKADESIKVPYVTKDASYKSVKIGPPQFLIPVTYHVSKGETLYSIAKKTENNIETIRMWNDLKTDAIKAGQKLIVGYNEQSGKDLPNHKMQTSAPGIVTTTTTVTEPTKKVKEDMAKKTKPVSPETKPNIVAKEIKPVPVEKAPVNPVTITTAPKETEKPIIPNIKPEVKPAPVVTSTPTTVSTSTSSLPVTKPVTAPIKEEGKLVYMTEKGIATWSKGNNDDGQLYALHPTAPVGTLITVKNMMNNSSVQVKVIGKLPNTADNHNVMIKLSGSAARQLNVLDDKFLATINYMGYKNMDEALK